MYMLLENEQYLMESSNTLYWEVQVSPVTEMLSAQVTENPLVGTA